MISANITSIIEKHLHQIAPEADLSSMDRDEDIRYQYDIDSMDFFRLMVAISDELGIEIPEEDYAGLVTVNKLVAFLESVQKK
jgi:acyl carrier protein